MAQEEEPEIAVVGAKGQIVIPQRLRKDLKITPKTKLVIYRKNDKLVVTKLKVPSLEEDLKELFKEIDQGYKGKKKKKPGEKEILEEIHPGHRHQHSNFRFTWCWQNQATCSEAAKETYCNTIKAHAG